jgi:hypothetical protein
MAKVKTQLDRALIKAKLAVLEKKQASDQLMVMFIIIAVAAGIAGLLYLFVTGTLLPDFQTKITNLIDGWFNHS